MNNMTLKRKVIRSGPRGMVIMIPSVAIKRMGIEPGDELVLDVRDDSILISREKERSDE